MLMADIITEARRVLGDTASQRWSNDRMIDIINRGVRDMSRHANLYRKEAIIELTRGRKRYPLPNDLLKITKLMLDGKELPILSLEDRPQRVYASKDLMNIGVLEINPMPTEVREPRMFAGVVGAFTAVSPSSGVASNPVHSLFGVTSSFVVAFDKINSSPYGIITGMGIRKNDYIVQYTGQTNGVITAISAPTVSSPDRNGIENNADQLRLVGKYGFPTSIVNKKDAVHMYYKSLPPKMQYVNQAFPLSAQWEDLILDWTIGTALADDNNASNNQRSGVFMQRYARNLVLASADSSHNYNNSPVEVSYNGGITKKKRRR